MDFFFIPDTCALAVHIACYEANIALQLREIEQSPTGLRLKTAIALTSDYKTFNPKQKVPAFGLPNGDILTENTSNSSISCLGAYSHDARYGSYSQNRTRTLGAVELLNFVTTAIHKAFSPLFNPNLSPKHRDNIIQDLSRAFSILQDTLGDKEFLIGPHMSVVDCYTWTLLSWTRFFDDVDISAWPLLVEYRQRILHRPSVQRALEEEGLAFEF
ncbi:glutathione S-transferase [Trichoderma barbatum]